MIRFHAISSAEGAIAYFGSADGGYYLDGSDLHREWTGLGAARLGLAGPPDFEHFKNLIRGLDPRTGEQLTAKLVDNRIPAWDITASVPKGVTTALEMGDQRIHEALWEANREAMAELERYVTTRVRKGGEHDDRITGNMVCFSVEHPETRPAKSDNKPDPDRHIHNVMMNVTYDHSEGEWKAIKFRPIMDMRRYFDRSFDLRLSTKLADLGYEIETKWKPDEKGGRKYFSWDIKDIPDSVTKKFSRRAGEVEKLAEDLGVVSPMGKDKLGATSRSYKRKDLTLDDLRDYWKSRITPEENRQIASTILRAMSGRNPEPEHKAPQAVEYAFLHEFERRSVVDWHDLAATAMERAMGGAMPEEIQPEAFKQGLLLKDGLATTRGVLAQENRVVAWAREGRGTCRGMGDGEGRYDESKRPESVATNLPVDPGTVSSSTQANSARQPDPSARRVNLTGQLDTLSPQQLAAVRHVWNSNDRVILIRGGAGTGKTHMMKAAIGGIDLPTVVLAPSSDASRGVLRKEGFKEADTLAKFLMDEDFQAKAQGGLIWVDEAGQVSMRQLDHLFKIADSLDARVVLQGDKKQHGAIERGATLRVLEEFAGLPVAELSGIRRQKGDYKEAVASIQKGDILGGYDRLASMGWVEQTPVFDHNAPIVDAYMDAMAGGKTALIVAPTHAEGDEITAEVRKRLKEAGKLGEDEVVFGQLKPLAWTEAERGDRDRYDGTEVIQFVRNSGPHKIGERIGAEGALAGGRALNPKHIAVYQAAELALAPGDRIRITAGGKSKDGHRLDNGAVYTVDGFLEFSGRDAGQGRPSGHDIKLSNGWILDGSQPLHVAHAYTTTSHASQGKTVDRVLIAMGGESRGAINAEQFYVSVSRAKESARIFTSLSPSTLREAIQKTDLRMTATELVGPARPKPKKKAKVSSLMKRVRDTYRQLREKAEQLFREPTRSKELSYER